VLDPKKVAREMSARTRAYLESLRAQGMSLYFGDDEGNLYEHAADGHVYASHIEGKRPVRDGRALNPKSMHDDATANDARRLRRELSRAIAEKIKANPEYCLSVARKYAEVLHKHSRGQREYCGEREFQEWIDILAAGQSAVLEILLSDDESTERLRIHTPFIGVEILSAVERIQIAQRAFNSP
jgi:hypothetical protein